MSIDARIEMVTVYPDGSGDLCLIARPARPGGHPGIAGQSRLRFDAAPQGVRRLQGLDVWGGDSGIMLGEVEIARREGYTRIVFCDQEKFNVALAAAAAKRERPCRN